jgi:hypothetical protein
MNNQLPFDFTTLQVQLRRLIPTAVVAVVGLVFIELAFRKWHPFELYGGWGSAVLQEKVDALDRIYKQNGAVDLITLSTSIGRPIDVRQFEEACCGQIQCYNFGFPEQRPERQRFMFENYFWPRYHIKNVIYGIAPPDVNSASRGMDPAHPRATDFWQYSAIKALTAETPLQKLRARIESLSVMFASRRHVRSTLQNGIVFELPPEKTIGDGVYIPNPRRIPTGPQELPWSLLPGMQQYNAYANYWAPEDGEFGEVLKLAKFCKARGVKFAVVEIPTSEYGHTQFYHPREDYTTFTRMLDWLSGHGVQVLPMARELNLDNSYFEDMEHLNRWGGQAITNYVYEHLVREWFADKVVAQRLPEPQQIQLYSNMPDGTSGVIVQRRFGINKDAQYTAYKQIAVTQPGVTIPVTSAAPGSYSLELYAGDGTTTSPEQTGEAQLALQISENGAPARSITLDKWVNARLSISYTQYHFSVMSTATVSLLVDKIGTRPCILDSAFLRPKLCNTGDGFTIE